MPRVSLIVAIALAVAACDRDAWSPRAEQARLTQDRAVALTAHLETLPGVTRASVLLDDAPADPLAPPAPDPAPRASIVLVLAPAADPDATTAAARAATLASVRDLADHDLVITARTTPAAAALASVGPFEVSPRSRGPLLATLAAALALIALLAAWIAITGARRRR